jgi:hypothetical protein
MLSVSPSNCPSFFTASTTTLSESPDAEVDAVSEDASTASDELLSSAALEDVLSSDADSDAADDADEAADDAASADDDEALLPQPAISETAMAPQRIADSVFFFIVFSSHYLHVLPVFPVPAAGPLTFS